MDKLIVAIVTALILPPLFGDGKFYGRENVPPGLPYQRAVIAHDGARELLILQSKYQGRPEEFGWVIPVPAVPDLGSIDSDRAHSLFRSLSIKARPRVVPLQMMIAFGIAAILLASGLSYGAIAIWRRIRNQESSKYLAMSLEAWALLFILLSVVLAVLGAPTLSTVGEAGGVDVIKAEQVGIYEVKVVSGQDSGELIAWLQKNGYRFQDTDRSTFDGYIRKKWCFVTARVDPKKTEEESWSGWEGLVDPLVLVFDSREVVYPLALTGTGGTETEVLLYLLTRHKMEDSSQRLHLDFASAVANVASVFRYVPFGEENFRPKWNFEQTYLTKWKGKLQPQQMQEDLAFRQAPDDTEYRKVIYR